MLWGTTPCSVVRRHGDRVLVDFQHPSEHHPAQSWVNVKDVPTMNHSEEADKALVHAIEEMALYGAPGLSSVLRALSWWADVRGLRGTVISQIENDLYASQVAAEEVHGVFDELDAVDAKGAIRQIETLRDELATAEREVDGLGEQVDALQYELDQLR